MYRKFPLNGIIVAAAAIAALVLTITRPSPEGLISFGVGDREVRAAPGKPAARAEQHDLTALEVFNLTLVRVREAYVDPARIDPKRMLYAALDSVQFNIPEVLVEPDEGSDSITVWVNDKKQAFSTQDVDSPWRLSGKLKKIFRFIGRHMNQGADLAKVEYAAVNGMLQTLDPHSVLLDPNAAKEMKANTSGKFGGLGIVIRMHNKKLTVVRPMRNTPAFEAGVQTGDHIYMINNETTENLTLEEAVDRMRGAPGSPVTIWVERKAQKDAKPSRHRFDLTRAIIQVESVESRMLSSNVGYIRIKQFSGRTGQEVGEAMQALRGQGAQGWVLDLRWNPGGLLEQAIDVSDLFVDKGTIVTTVGGREREPRRAKRKGSDTSSPVAVLVNGSSASASEIVAGALKNLDRATVIGSTTFGKGSVQILFDNDDGSQLKLTIAQYLTPGDRSIQSLGIVPDIALNRMFVPEKNQEPKDQVRLLPPSKTYREADLQSHLTSSYAKKDGNSTYELRFLYELPKSAQKQLLAEDDANEPPIFDEEEPLEDEFVEDFEIKLARDVVVQAGRATRTETVQSAKRLVAQRAEAEQKKLAQALTTLGVDWSEAPSASVAKAQQLHVDLEVRKGGVAVDTINAGDEVELVGTVTNRTDKPAYQVHARIGADDPIFNDTELIFGHIAPGASRTWTTRLKVPEREVDRANALMITLREGRGSEVQLAPRRVRVVAAERPVFAYAHQLVDDGNGDGLVQKGETHRLKVAIKNSGKGDAREAVAVLRNMSGDGVSVKKGRFELGKLKAGETRDVEFEFVVGKDLKANELLIEMTVYDPVLHESMVEKLTYPLAPVGAGPVAATGNAEIVRDGTTIYEGAAADAPAIARADAGAVLRITGRHGDWLRVALADDRPGFVAATDVKRSRRAPSSQGITTVWQVTPPTLALTIPSYETADAMYQLRGKATDETHVEDVYVFVSNFDAKVDNKKVFYKSNRNGKNGTTLDFTANVPLWPGSNHVTVVARENGDVKSMRTMVLYRGNQATAAAATP